jgi:hypothetical protein
MVHILPASTQIDADQMSPIRAAVPVFRFGGYELGQPGAEAMLNEFFDEVHSRMG